MPIKIPPCKVLIGLALAFTSYGLFAQTVTNQDNFFQRKGEGWYWYQDPVLQKEQSEIQSIPMLEQPPSRIKKKAKPVKSSEHQPFSAAWVREMLPKYRDAMWTEPTPENVKAYFLLQRFAIDRSQKVAEVAQSVIGNRFLDENFRRPISGFGNQFVDQKNVALRKEVLQKIGKDAGLFFFFRSDCPYCERQAPLLELFERMNNVDVLAISVDGGNLQSIKFKSVEVDHGQAQMLGIQRTPALFLVARNKVGTFDFEPIGEGLLSMPEIEERIFIAAHRRGLISDDVFQKTKPIIEGAQNNDLSELLQNSMSNPAAMFGSKEAMSNLQKSLSKQNLESVMDKDGFIPQKVFVELFEPQPKAQWETKHKAHKAPKAPDTSPQNTKPKSEVDSEKSQRPSKADKITPNETQAKSSNEEAKK